MAPQYKSKLVIVATWRIRVLTDINIIAQKINVIGEAVAFVKNNIGGKALFIQGDGATLDGDYNISIEATPEHVAKFYKAYIMITVLDFRHYSDILGNPLSTTSKGLPRFIPLSSTKWIAGVITVKPDAAIWKEKTFQVV